MTRIIWNSGLRRLMLALCVVMALGAVNPAMAAGRRVALIIGNSNYTNSTGLPNAINDARLVVGSAQKAGFEVIIANDLSKASFEQALRQFRTRADGAEAAMVYYAGHGIENGGSNYMIPVDAKLSDARDLRFEAINLVDILDNLSGATVRMVFLDACRENPFGKNWVSASRSVQNGLAPIEQEGVLVVFATATGSIATDGTGGNSPFARALANRLPEQGLALQLLGNKIKDDVAAATGGLQRPYSNNGLGGAEFYLVPKPAPVVGNDGADYKAAQTAGTIAAYTAYIAKNPNGMFVSNAYDRIEMLKDFAKNAPVAPAPAPLPPAPVAAPVMFMPTPAPQPMAPQPAQVIYSPAPQPAPASAPAPAPYVALPQPAPVTYAPTPAPVPAPQPAAPLPGPQQAAVYPAPMSQPPMTSQPAVFQPTVAGPTAVSFDQSNLPPFPLAPAFPKGGYPDCRESFQSITGSIAKLDAINACQRQLTQYQIGVLNPYQVAVNNHLAEVSTLYKDQVGGHQEKYTAASQNAFLNAVLKRHADSQPGGPVKAEYEAALAKRDADAKYLSDRYCFYSGTCGGYTAPSDVAQTTPTGK
ncbi:MAG: caspase family protein [Novosphingobium sp.]